MANFFPCPNAACTYQFDAGTLPAAAMVTCPICRTRFPYRAAPVAPVAPPVPPQDYGSQYAGEDTQTRPHAPPRERVNRLVNPKPVPKNNKTQTTLLLVGFTLLSATVLLTIFLSMKRGFFSQEDDKTSTYTDDLFNFRIKKFGTWREDPALRGELGFNAFLMKDPDIDAWIGLRCVNLGGGTGIRGPREGELDIELNGIFKKFKNRPQTTPIEAVIGKQSVKGVEFTGELKDIPVWGQAFVFDYKGIGYVMMTWSAQDKWEGIKKQLAVWRDSFEFAGQRDKWTDQGGNVVWHFVDNGDYEVGDAYGIWDRAIPEEGDKKVPHKVRIYVRNATDEDPNATLLLRCKYPIKNKVDHVPTADAMLLVLPKADTVEDVKKYILDARMKSDGDAIGIEEYQKRPSDTPIPSSAASVGVFRMTNKVDKTINRYYAVALLKVNGRSIAAVGWCRERDAEYMERYILSLVASLKAR